ncbi:hypothetical protein [Bartonella sp. LJL80]
MGNKHQDLHSSLMRLDCFLRRHDSATLALQKLCEGRTLTISRLNQLDRPIPEVFSSYRGRAQNAVAKYRHVAIKDSETTLSLAHNWYFPSILSSDMNEQLSETDKPFGLVCAALAFKRVSLRSTLFWHNLNEIRDNGDVILRHCAVLTLADGAPISFVEENYLIDIFSYTNTDKLNVGCESNC